MKPRTKWWVALTYLALTYFHHALTSPTEPVDAQPGAAVAITWTAIDAPPDAGMTIICNTSDGQRFPVPGAVGLPLGFQRNNHDLPQFTWKPAALIPGATFEAQLEYPNPFDRSAGTSQVGILRRYPVGANKNQSLRKFLACDARGTRCVLGTDENNVIILNLVTGQMQTFQLPGDRPAGATNQLDITAAVSDDGRFILLSDGSSVWYLEGATLDNAKFRGADYFKFPGKVEALALSSDGKGAAVLRSDIFSPVGEPPQFRLRTSDSRRMPSQQESFWPTDNTSRTQQARLCYVGEQLVCIDRSKNVLFFEADKLISNLFAADVTNVGVPYDARLVVVQDRVAVIGSQLTLFYDISDMSSKSWNFKNSLSTYIVGALSAEEYLNVDFQVFDTRDSTFSARLRDRLSESLHTPESGIALRHLMHPMHVLSRSSLVLCWLQDPTALDSAPDLVVLEVGR